MKIPTRLLPDVRVRAIVAAALALAQQLCAADDGLSIKLIDKPPAGPFTHYQANRAPLVPSALVRLPMGAVLPDGWLKQQLVLQGAGFHGHLTEISPFLKKDNNSWLSPTGTGNHGWEEVPYWLKGFLGCAILTKDTRMLAEAKIWIEGALGSQQPDGWFGPGKGRTGVATDLKGRDDLWPNMIMLFCLQTWFEYTGDARVPDLMTKYFRYLDALPEDKLLLGYWPSMRGGDQLYSILWLYNRTGDHGLLDLAHKTHRRTARWDTITDTPGKQLPNWHNVNITQAFREPTTYWMLSNIPAERDGSARAWDKIRTLFGQVPGGLFGADENARPGHSGPRQAIETCGIAEEMLSDAILTSVTGDPLWAEHCEDAAFNSFPAAFTADWKALRYLTAPNQPQSDHATKAPVVQNGGPMFEMNPNIHRCCQHNAGHGWPYFTQHLWFASPDNGLAAYIYGPCVVTAKVADGTDVRISEQTRYPFEEQITLTINLPDAAHSKPTRFPLDLRVPSWCAAAAISINGNKSLLPAGSPGKVIRLERAWQDGDVVLLELPMTVRTQRWSNNYNTASVSRGPLTYSLQIQEEYRRHGGPDAWPAWDIFPTSPWNYGLTADAAAAFSVIKGTWPADDQPFRNEATPIKLTTSARKIPNWTLDPRGAVNEVVAQPVISTEPVETVTLIPMGAARLRITAFPVIDNGPNSHEWPALEK
ncbi:MAG: beta-L-arabinofuranosidase domain-containing protein [Verrucomicrobiota bacterium]